MVEFANTGEVEMEDDVSTIPLRHKPTRLSTLTYPAIHPLIRARHDKIDLSLYYLDGCCNDEEEEEASFGGRE